MMASSGRKKHLSFSLFRRRQQAANHRRFCIIWINRMAEKEVQKQIADLNLEFFHMNDALREEMMAEIQEQLREFVAKETNERSLHYTKLVQEPQITLRWLREMEEYKKKAEEDEVDEAKSLDLETSFNFSEKPSDTNSIFIRRKLPIHMLQQSSRIFLDVSTDGDINDGDINDGDIGDGDTSHVSSVSDTSSREQEVNLRISSDVGTAAKRRRQQAAKHKRFCIIWIKRMAKKEVEKRIADLHSELFCMNDALRKEMMAEIQEQLRELLAKETNERSLHYTELVQDPRMTLRWLREMEEYKKNAEEDKVDEAKSLDLETLSFNFSEKPSDTNSIFIRRKLPKHVLEESSRIFLDVSTDGEINDGNTSDCDTSHVSSVSDISSHEREEIQKISSDVATAANTSQLMREDRSSRNPFHSFVTEKLKYEAERVRVNRTLIKEQWKEWMDKQEMRENHNKVKPVNQTEKQGEVAPPASEKQMKQNIKGVDTMMKIKTYLSDLFNPNTSYMWERLEDED